MGELNIYEVQGAQNTSDYIGFTFNGIHSSELGIKRTSDGSRFNENLLPTSEDKTVQIPGGDGTYYFGSYYIQKQFDISFAFDFEPSYKPTTTFTPDSFKFSAWACP